MGIVVHADVTEKELWPRIALVTPVRNSAKYLEQSIQSVLAQGYVNLDYYIIDGGSTDGSVEIIRKYERQISGWVSEPDRGMYDALNKGFARTSGEIMGWISATDQLHIGGLKVVGSVFRDFREIEWISGRRTAFNDDGITVRVDPVLRWSRHRFLAGANRHIQQESTYWRKSLWDKAGAYVDAEWRYASDFELWLRFFRYAQLYSVDALIGGFREHPDSNSLQDHDEFASKCDNLARAELMVLSGKWFERYCRMDTSIAKIPKVRAVWYKAKALALRAMELIPGSDLTPIIECHDGTWRMRQ